jgi:hypothetical protein
VPVRWGRTLGVALPLIVANTGWIAHSEMRTGVTEITITPLFIGVTFWLFALCLLNTVVRRLWPRAALTQPELLGVFALLSLSSAVAGIGNFGFFLPFLVGVFRFGAANGWEKLWPDLPATIGPRDPAVLKAFYEGRSSILAPGIARAWAGPLLYWGVFFFVLLATLLCLAALLRRRWDDQEHLPFPVVALPLELTRDDGALLRQRLLWAGFALPALLHSVNTVHSVAPAWPSLPINTFVQALDGAPFPWTGLGSVPLLVHPCGIGFGYLVHTDVLFSLLFFWAFKRALNLLGTVLGWRDPGPNEYGDGSDQFPFTGYQAWGAWLAVGVMALVAVHGTLAHRLRDPAGDVGEPLPARAALWGVGIGFLALCAMLWAAGAPVWVPAVFLAIYLLLMIALARIQAEMPVLSLLLAWVSPQAMLTGVVGTANLSRGELVSLGTLSWFNLDYRAAVLPQQLQGFVAIKRAGSDPRPLVGALLLGGAVAIVSALAWDLQLYQMRGAATPNVNAYRINMGNSVWWALNGWVSGPKPASATAVLWSGIGAAVTFGLGILRTRLVGFPLAPSAYVLTTTFAHEHFWIDMAIAWIVKSAFLRYGGMALYRAALPFFLGLILGDFVTGSVWSIVGAVFGIELFRTFPN